MTLGERIAAQRSALRLSQSDLAEQLDVSRQSVSKWETDASVPELDKLTKMCEIFDLTMDQLVRGIEPEETPAAPKETFVKQGVTLRQIVGVVLLGAGFLVLLLAALLTRQIMESFLLALPLLALGLPALVFKRTPLWYGWVLYGLALWLMPRVTGMGYLSLPLLLSGSVLLVITVRRIWNKHEKTP